VGDPQNDTTALSGLSVEIDRVVKRRDLQSDRRQKTRWVEQIDLHLESGRLWAAGELLELAKASSLRIPNWANWIDWFRKESRVRPRRLTSWPKDSSCALRSSLNRELRRLARAQQLDDRIR